MVFTPVNTTASIPSQAPRSFTVEVPKTSIGAKPTEEEKKATKQAFESGKLPEGSRVVFNVPDPRGGGGGSVQQVFVQTGGQLISKETGEKPSGAKVFIQETKKGAGFGVSRVRDTKSFDETAKRQPTKPIEEKTAGTAFFERVGKIGIATGTTIASVPIFAVSQVIPIGETEIGKKLNQSLPGGSFGRYPFEASVITGGAIGVSLANLNPQVKERGLIVVGEAGVSYLKTSFKKGPETFAGTIIGLGAFPGVKKAVVQDIRVFGAKEIPASQIVDPKVLAGANFPTTPRGKNLAGRVLSEFKNNPFAYEKGKLVVDVKSEGLIAKGYGKELTFKVRLPAEPQMYHATGELLKGKEVIGKVKRSSDAPVMYGAPSASVYFARLGGGELPKLTLLAESSNPTIYSVRVSSFERIPASVRSRGLGAMREFLIKKQGGSGKAFITPAVELGVKAETEAGVARGNIFKGVIPEGGVLTRFRGFKEFINVEGTKLPIRVIEFRETPKKPSFQTIESKRIVKGFRETESYSRGERYAPIGKYPGLILSSLKSIQSRVSYGPSIRSSIKSSSPSSIVSSIKSSSPSSVVSSIKSSSGSSVLSRVSSSRVSISRVSSPYRSISSGLSSRVSSPKTSYSGYGYSTKSFQTKKTFPLKRPLPFGAPKSPFFPKFSFKYGKEFRFAQLTAGKAIR